MPKAWRVETPEATAEHDAIAWAGLERLAERDLERVFNAYRAPRQRALAPNLALAEWERDCNRTTPEYDPAQWDAIHDASVTLRTIRACGRSLGALRKRRTA